MQAIIPPKLRARHDGRLTTGHTAGPCARCQSPVSADTGFMDDLPDPFHCDRPRITAYYCAKCVAKKRQTAA